MELTAEEVEIVLEDAIYNFEMKRRTGKDGHGLGHWMYLRIYNTDDGIEIVSGMEASPVYPEAEYFGEGDYPPITFHTCQELFSPGPEDGVEWEADEKGEYIHDKNYKWHPISDFEDKEIEEMTKTGWIRFTMGDTLVDPLDVDNIVSEAMAMIREIWNIG